MSRHSWPAVLVALVAVQVALLFLYQRVEQGHDREGLVVTAEPRSEPGHDLVVELSDGFRHSVTARSDRYQLIHFWATWCPPCVKEIPSLSGLARRDPARLRVWAVSTDPRWENLRDFFRGRVPDHVVRDPRGEEIHAYSVRGLPDSYLVNPEGRVVARFAGGQDWGAKEMDEILSRLTREIGRVE